MTTYLSKQRKEFIWVTVADWSLALGQNLIVAGFRGLSSHHGGQEAELNSSRKRPGQDVAPTPGHMSSSGLTRVCLP